MSSSERPDKAGTVVSAAECCPAEPAAQPQRRPLLSPVLTDAQHDHGHVVPSTLSSKLSSTLSSTLSFARIFSSHRPYSRLRSDEEHDARGREADRHSDAADAVDFDKDSDTCSNCSNCSNCDDCAAGEVRRAQLRRYHRQSVRHRWMVCGLVIGLTLSAILLVLNVLLYLSRSVYDGDDRPDLTLSNWGAAGSGTEDLAWYPTDLLRDVVPVPCHSHNDYWRRVPLFSALRAGCISVEADLWLIDDELYVGHERIALTPARTFRSLYVDPLVEMLDRANTDLALVNGSADAAADSAASTARGVFDTDPDQTLVLLIDIKTRGEATLRRALEQVAPLRARGWLTTYEDGRLRPAPVTLVGSGNTPFAVVAENATRDVFFDAPLDALDAPDAPYDSTNSYYASAPIGRALGHRLWRLGAPLLRDQRRRLHQQLRAAHARGLRARYWSLPAWPLAWRNAVWTDLVAEGVDLLNVDDVRAAARADWAAY